MKPIVASVAALTLLPLMAIAAEANLNGLKVHYESRGKGPRAIVFIHGWTCDHTFWRLNTPAVETTHRVLLVDLPGHGASDKPEIAYTMSLFARGVEAVMRKAGVRKAVLVGHSMGVPVIRQFIREFPNKVSGVVLVDGGIARQPPDQTAMKQFIAQFRGPGALEFRTKTINGMFVDATPQALRKEILKKMLAAPEHVAVSAREGMADPATHVLDKIDLPALFVFARKPQTAPDNEQFLRTVLLKMDYEVD